MRVRFLRGLGREDMAKRRTTEGFIKRAEAVKARLTKERDTLTELIDDLEAIREEVIESEDAIDEAVDYIRRVDENLRKYF